MRINPPPFESALTEPSINVIGESEDKLAIAWQQFMTILNNQLNINFSDNGYVFPAVIQTTLDKIKQDYKQSIVYNSDKNRFELNNGNRSNDDDTNYEPIQTYGPLNTANIATEAIKDKNLGRIFVNSDTNELQFSINGSTVRTIMSV